MIRPASTRLCSALSGMAVPALVVLPMALVLAALRLSPLFYFFAFNTSLMSAIFLSRFLAMGYGWKSTWRKVFALLCVFSLVGLLAVRPAQATIITEYSLRTNSRPVNIAVNGTGHAWFTEQFGQANGAIGLLTISTGAVNEWILPRPSEPWGIAIQNSTGVWFTEYYGNRIGVLNSATNKIREWTIPTTGSGPREIVVNRTSADAVWFTEYFGNRIGKLKPSTNEITEYTIPTPNSGPIGITMDILNRTIWFTEYTASKIGMFNLTTSVFKEYTLSSGVGPWSIKVDPDGYVWFTLEQVAGMGRLNPWTGEVLYVSTLTSGSMPRGIAIDPRDRSVWLAEYGVNKIGKYAPAQNVFFEYPTPTAGSNPQGVALYLRSGAASEVFFTEWSTDKIGRLTIGGPTVTVTVSSLTTATFGVGTAGTATTSFVRSPVITTYSTQSVLATVSIASLRWSTITDTSSYMFTTTTGVSITTLTEYMFTTVTATSSFVTYVQTTYITSTTRSTSTSISHMTTVSGTSSVVSTVTSYVTIYTTSTITRTTVGIETTTLTSTIFNATDTAVVTERTTATALETVLSTMNATETITVTTTTTTPTPTRTVTVTLPTLPTVCPIGYAVQDSELYPAAQYLRGFRDREVTATFAGKQFLTIFNRWYYSFAPNVAAFMADHPWAREAAKLLLYPLVAILHLSSDSYSIFSFNPELGVIVAGLTASALIGLIYVSPPVTALTLLAKRRGRILFRSRLVRLMVGLWLMSLVLTGFAEISAEPLLMMIATASSTLMTLSLASVAVAHSISRRIS